MLGRKVATLVNQVQQAGSYEVEFNADSMEKGVNLASGVYIYQFRSGTFINSKKFVLLK